MAGSNSSLWTVMWLLGPVGVVVAVCVLLVSRRRQAWFHHFDPKNNQGFPKEAGTFRPIWKRYESLCTLCITLSAGAVAFLINLLVNQGTSPTTAAENVRRAAPMAIGFFSVSIVSLIVLLLWLTTCYEAYLHSPRHDTYRAWKYALSYGFAAVGLIAFLAGFVCVGSEVSRYSAVVPAHTTGNASVLSFPAPQPLAPPPAICQRVFDFLSSFFLSPASLAIATWGLVIVTALLVWDGRNKSKEQRLQWKLEAEIREAEAKPTAVIEIAIRDDAPTELHFAIFNLGNNTFYVDKMIVTTADGTTSTSDLSPQVVTPGASVLVDYDPSELVAPFGENTPGKDAASVFVLRGATGRVTTEPEWFSFTFLNGGLQWRKGRQADRRPGTLSNDPKVVRIPDEDA